MNVAFDTLTTPSAERTDPALGKLSTLTSRRTMNANEIKAEMQRQNLLQGPLAIVLIRHGRAAGNDRDAIRNLGAEHEAVKSAFAATAEHDLPLLELGVQQSEASGRLIAHLCAIGMLPTIDRGFTSPFTRPTETLKGVFRGIHAYCVDHGIDPAAVYNPSGSVEILPAMGERYWGDFSHLPIEEQDLGYEARKREPYFWTPGSSGERLDEVLMRARSVLQKFHRPSYAGKVLIGTSHGEFMNAVELACHELDPFGEKFKESFNNGIPNAGVYVFSQLPFSRDTDPGVLTRVAGMQYYLKALPYEVAGDQATRYKDWIGELTWREREQTRIAMGDFMTTATLSQSSRDIAGQLAVAGIGKSSVTARF